MRKALVFEVGFGQFTLTPVDPIWYPPMGGQYDGRTLADVRTQESVPDSLASKLVDLFGRVPGRAKGTHMNTPNGYWWKLTSQDRNFGDTFVVVSSRGSISIVMSAHMMPSGIMRNVVSYQMRLRLEKMLQ